MYNLMKAPCHLMDCEIRSSRSSTSSCVELFLSFFSGCWKPRQWLIFMKPLKFQLVKQKEWKSTAMDLNYWLGWDTGIIQGSRKFIWDFNLREFFFNWLKNLFNSTKLNSSNFTVIISIIQQFLLQVHVIFMRFIVPVINWGCQPKLLLLVRLNWTTSTATFNEGDRKDSTMDWW